jgi:hypothetical protein
MGAADGRGHCVTGPEAGVQCSAGGEAHQRKVVVRTDRIDIGIADDDDRPPSCTATQEP